MLLFKKPRGFTIIEMLVVIGIIALLLGMLLPALAGVNRRAKKSEEMNYLRQIGAAWVLYANANNDAALPGHLSPGTQERWRVSYKFMDGSKVPPGDSLPSVTPPEMIDTNDPANVAGPWTFRLLPYLQNNHEVVHSYSSEADRDDLHLIADAQEVSQHPAFGYNGFYVGGVWHRVNISDSVSGGNIDMPAPRFNWATSQGFTGVPGPANVISRSVSAISRSTGVITFCSAAPLPRGQVRQFLDDQPGGHLVHAPYLARERQWGPSTGFNEGGGGGTDPGGVGGGGGGGFSGGGGGGGGGVGSVGLGNKFEIFADDCTAPVGRYTNLAVVIYADNHIEQALPLSLFDMRKWCNSATDKIWVHTEGP